MENGIMNEYSWLIPTRCTFKPCLQVTYIFAIDDCFWVDRVLFTLVWLVGLQVWFDFTYSESENAWNKSMGNIPTDSKFYRWIKGIQKVFQFLFGIMLGVDLVKTLMKLFIFLSLSPSLIVNESYISNRKG